MASASSCSTCISRPPPINRHVRSQFIVRAQLGQGEEGKSMNNMVDANMNVLRERINQVKIRERLARSYEHDQGWCYSPGYDVQLKRNGRLAEFGKIAAMAAGGFGLSVAGCTILLYLFSLIIQITN